MVVVEGGHEVVLRQKQHELGEGKNEGHVLATKYGKAGHVHGCVLTVCYCLQ